MVTVTWTGPCLTLSAHVCCRDIDCTLTAMRRTLSERVVRDAKPSTSAYVIWDQELIGVGCKIHPSGQKRFVLTYLSRGVRRQSTLGRCSEMSLREARDRARVELVRIRDGEPGPVERRHELLEAPTVNDALTRFFDETIPERMAAGRLSERTAREYRAQARRYVAPAIGTMQVAQVTRHDVEALATTLSDRPSQRNRVLAFISSLFSWTERWEWRPQHTNPVRGIERGREHPRRRILTKDEFAALSKALKSAEEERGPSVAAIRIAALTGLRISEVIAMRWPDIDLDTGRVTLRATKTGPRVHDLPATALDLVKDLPRLSDWVFSYRRSAPVTYRTVRLHFAEIVERAGLKGVWLHDLRRTLITAAAASGESVFVIRGLLGHTTTAMAARYVQEAGLAVREARERAGRTVAAMMDGTAGDERPDATDDGFEAGQEEGS